MADRFSYQELGTGQFRFSKSSKDYWIISSVDAHKKFWSSFSFAEGATVLFSIFACLVVLAIGYFAPKLTSKGWSVVLGLALGGILGNLSDRIFREPGFFTGHVIDWIELPNWPVFNLADSAIVIAAAIAVFLSIKNISPIEGSTTEGEA